MLIVWPFFCVIAGSIAWRVCTHNSLIRALLESDDNKLQAQLLALNNTPKVISLGENIESMLSKFDNRSFKQQTQTLRRLTFDTPLATSQNLEQLRDQFELLTIGLSEPVHSDPLIAEVFTAIEQAKTFAQSRERTEDEIKASKSDVQSIHQQYELIATDCKELFGLPFTQPTGDISISAFYQSGVLANIPKLDGLKDGIDQMSDLSRALEIAGGRVQFQGADAAQQFDAALTRVKQSSAELLAEIQANNQHRAELKSSAENSRNQLAKQTKLVQLKLKKLLAKIIYNYELY